MRDAATKRLSTRGIRLARIAEVGGGRVVGDGEFLVHKLASLHNADDSRCVIVKREENISFVSMVNTPTN